MNQNDGLELKSICKEFDAISIYHFGNTNSKKDIDLIIISNSFRGISIFKRKSLIRKINYLFDPICFSEKEFEKFKLSNSSLWNELLKSGILVYGREKRFS